MNKITVIQLLNKIANNEEVPPFKWYARTLIWNNEHNFFEDLCDENYCKTSFEVDTLNDEVEIIEEDKEIEEIEFDEIDELTNYDIYFHPECSDDSKENFKDKINELIRNQKKIIKAVNELKKGK